MIAWLLVSTMINESCTLLVTGHAQVAVDLEHPDLRGVDPGDQSGFSQLPGEPGAAKSDSADLNDVLKSFDEISK